MPRIRTFKPEFFRSPDTARTSHAGRILFMAMWSWADDFGTGETNLYGLLGFAFPDEDGMTAEDLQRLLKEIGGSFGVRFYINRGRYFYAVPSWDKHQKTERKAGSRHPGPDHEDSRPDLRFGTSEEIGGFSSGPECGSVPGTGEQGNIGTGKSFGGAGLESHQGANAVAPPPKCSRHINDIDPPDCGSCANYRRAHDAFNAKEKLAERDQLEERRQQREAEKLAGLNCKRCGGTNFYEVSENAVAPCNHQEAM